MLLATALVVVAKGAPAAAASDDAEQRAKKLGNLTIDQLTADGRRTRTRWGLLVGALISVAALGMPATLAATEIPLAAEYEIKAAFLVNFSQFVEWPADVLGGASGPIVIGILGGDPFGATLDTAAAGRQVHGHPIVVRRVTSPDDAAGCQVLFIGTATEPDVLAKVAGQSILTVGEAAGFSHRGGIIEFFVQDQKVRFAINLEAATAARLKVSSRLAQLAGTRNGIEPVRQ